MIYHREVQLAAKNYILVTKAVNTPVTLEEVKANARIDSDDFDDLIFPLIGVATSIGENITGRDFINKTYKGFLDCFPHYDSESIQIRKSKLQSITTIEYYIDGVLTTMTSTDYYITESNEYSTINLVEGKSWPATDTRAQAIVINFIAGYGLDQCSVPDAIKRAIISNVELLRTNAGDCPDAEAGSNQITSLYTPYILSTKLVSVI